MFALLSYRPQPQQACGPISQEAIFSFSVHPDFPMEKYAAGQLGVIQPSYARSYLYVAYRYFAGLSFDQAEQKAIASVWRERLDQGFEENQPDAQKLWLEARGKVQGLAPAGAIDVFRSPSKEAFQAYLNCPDDAFQNAAKTLNERIARFGAGSPQVREWAQAQDEVFKNCSEGQSIPAPAGPSAQPLVQADRNYQIAAANFYAQNYDAADQLFSAIAADKNSPYRQIAPYLAARALVRKGTLMIADEGKVDAPTLRQAEARLQKILSDNSLSAIHGSARQSLSFVSLRLNPQARLRELAQAAMQRNPGAGIRQTVWDYTALMNKFVKDDDESVRKFENLPTAERADDLTDWVMVFQVTDNGARDYAVQKWSKTPSLPWLVAALAKVDAGHPQTAQLLAAAAKVPASSPAYASVAFHQARLLIEGRKFDEARRLLDGVLQGRASMPPSSVNEFLSLRMRTAGSLDEFLKYAQRTPTAFSYNVDGRELPSSAEEIKEDTSLKDFANGRLAFDEDSRAILNQKFPLTLLKEAAANQTLPPYLRREIAQAAWARAALLDDEALGKELALLLQSLAPDLKAPLNDYVNAASGNDKKFAAIYFLLKYPGIEPYVDAGVGRHTALPEIDNYRDNWWCADFISGLDKLNGVIDPDNPAAAGDGKVPTPEFMALSQAALAIKELAKIRALGTAPNYLCAQAVRLTTLKPADPRSPEMLHLAVKSTRYGCTNKETGRFSKLAYDQLHKNYPKSEWAAKTKFWFKGD